MISYLVLFIFVLVIALMGAASYTDIRTREVPDFISYILIAGGFFMSIIISIDTYSISNLEFMPLAVLVLFGFAYLMYVLGQWGGGDVKLMLGLSMVFTSVNLYSNFSFIALFINMMIFGGLYGIVGTVVYGLIKIKRLIKFVKLYDIALVAVGVAAIIGVLLLVPPPFSFLFAFSVFLLVSMRYIYVVANNLMFIDVHVNKLTEGDWLADDVKDESGKVVVKHKPTGLEKEDIKKLKEHGIKTVLVKIGLPFVPGLLIGVLITLVFGNPLLQLIAFNVYL
ncbi:MAG: A24 family peptidase [Candidatus Parvarchaeota archaeon]|nr:A24 family peptidase [Candidatus Parvarchaeota archaeon]